MTEQEYFEKEKVKQEIYASSDCTRNYKYQDFGVFGQLVIKDTLQSRAVGYAIIQEFYYEALYTGEVLAGYACQRVCEEYLQKLGGE